MSKYMSCKETAVMIRQALKESFPGIKFGVRSDVYSMGASIRVNWTDGPNQSQVDAVVQTFRGSYFDGSIDYKGSVYSMINGEQVKFGADFIFTNREYSDAAIQKAINAVYREFKNNFSDDDKPLATVEDYRKGALFGRAIPSMGDGYGYWSLSQVIGRKLDKNSDRLEVKMSATANKVIYLGNDGYSPRGALNAQDLGVN